MKKGLLSCFLLVCLVLVLGGCGEKTSNTPEAVMTAMLEDFKAGRDVDSYFTADGLGIAYSGEERELEYTVAGSLETAEQAIVTVDITGWKLLNVEMVKRDDDWKIDSDEKEELIRAMMGLETDQ